MNTVPLELHSYICQLACKDDRLTTQSLALVSKYFSEVARPFRYQSIAVAGPERITALHNKLAGFPPHMRRIRHLFLSDKRDGIIDQPAKSTSRLNDAEKTTVIQFLLLAAPTLETLAFSASCTATSTTLI